VKTTGRLAHAACIVVLFDMAHRTAQVVTETSGLKAYPLAIIATAGHLDHLAHDYRVLADAARSCTEAAEAACGKVTAHTLSRVARDVDKLVWILRSHSQYAKKE
jgi:DNA-binding ferritin-like protein